MMEDSAVSVESDLTVERKVTYHMAMTKRTGNNYSGARWTFSQGQRKSRTVAAAGGGISIMGGSARPTIVHRDGCSPSCRPDESEPTGGHAFDCPNRRRAGEAFWRPCRVCGVEAQTTLEAKARYCERHMPDAKNEWRRLNAVLLNAYHGQGWFGGPAVTRLIGRSRDA